MSMLRRFLFEFLLDLLQFLLECLILDRSPFAPRLALRFGLGCISGDFATVNILVTLFLALEFCAQFVFRHVIT